LHSSGQVSGQVEELTPSFFSSMLFYLLAGEEGIKIFLEAVLPKEKWNGIFEPFLLIAEKNTILSSGKVSCVSFFG